MLPSLSTSMFSAAGTLGRPGMVRTLPVSATTKWAPGGNLELTHRDAEVLGSAQGLGVVAKAVLRLGDAHRQVAKAILAQLGELALGGRRKVNAVGAVDLGGNGIEGISDISAVLIGKLELARLLNQTHDLIGQLECALATLGPDLG